MVQSLRKGIDILFLFTRDHPTMTVKEIAQSIGAPLATAYRLVTTLREKGLIQRNSVSGHYSLGLKLLELGGAIHSTMDLESLAIPFLQKLAKSSGETVQLTVVNSDRGVCIYVEESPSTLRMAPRKGDGLPLHAGASVQAILAFLPLEEQNRILKGPLEQFTPHTINSPEGLRRRLVKIREQGFIITAEEVYVGSVGIAAPIFKKDGRVIASVAVSGPIQRMTKERREAITREVVRVALTISRAFGFHPE